MRSFVFVFFYVNLISILFFNSVGLTVSFDHSHEINFSHQVYNHHFTNADKNQNYLYLISKNKLSLNSNIDLSIMPEFFYLQSKQNSEMNFAYLEPGDSHVSLFYDTFSIKTGSYYLKKEGPDIFDPLDVIMPKNFMNPIKPTKQAIFGVKFEKEWTSFLTTEANYIFKNKLPVLPKTNSPWYPRENKFPTTSDSYNATLPEQVNYSIIENQTANPHDLNDNWLFKIKMNLTSTDLILQYAEAVSSQPDITPTLKGSLISTDPIYTIELENPVELIINWHKVKNYGFGITQQFTQIGLLAKVFTNYEVGLAQQKASTAIALEKQISSNVVVLEYSHQSITQDSATRSAKAATFANIFENTLALGFRWATTDASSLLIGSMYDLKMNAYLLNIKPKISWHEKYYSEFSLILLGGKPNSLLWFYDQNDSASLTFGMVL